jgi:multiple sugar transport system substrate-binding protein
LGAIAKSSPHGEAAARLLAWLSGPEWGSRVAAASPATTLFRRSQLDSPQPWGGAPLGPGAAGLYAQTVAAALDGHASLAAPRISGRSRYLEALDRGVRQALAGELSSQAALDAVAGEWRAISEEMGLDRQRSAYRRSLGLR